MTWLDLHEGILEEFADRAATLDPEHSVFRSAGDRAGMRFRSAETRIKAIDPEAWEQRLADKRLRRRADRAALAAAIPPCPHCGGKVERAAPGGPLPVYCSERCRNLERHKRWRKNAKRPSRAGQRRSKTRLPAMCVECGTDFMARHPLTLTCGEVCGKERRLRDARARAAEQYRLQKTAKAPVLFQEAA